MRGNICSKWIIDSFAFFSHSSLHVKPPQTALLKSQRECLGLEGTSGDHQVQPPAKSRFTQSRLPRVMSRQSWTCPEENPQPLWTAPASALSSTEPLPSRSTLTCLGARSVSVWAAGPHACLAELPWVLLQPVQVWLNGSTACWPLLPFWNTGVTLAFLHYSSSPWVFKDTPNQR